MSTKAFHRIRGNTSLNLRRKGIFRPRIEILESRLALATVLGVTGANALVQFDSATPGTISAPTPITGLVGGETIQGIDFRPATGQLYGVTDQSRVYTIDVSTGAATLASTVSTALAGAAFGVDFNPVPDRLRIVSDADQNLRINVDTGAALVDGTLLYDDTTADGDPIDPNAGQNPTVVDAAYINSFGGATATTLFGIDAGLDVLVIQNPPNAGTLNTVGALGIDVVNIGGFDILAQAGGSNAGFAALSTDGTSSGFYTIDLTTGAATLVGSVSDVPTLLAGIAVVPEVTNLSVDKVGPATITAGTRVIETITVTNAGPSAASNVVLTDVLPPGIMESGFAQQSGPPATLAFNGTNTFTAMIPVLAVGETAVFIVGIDVPANFSEGSTVTNTASVASDTPDPLAANDSDTATSTIVTSADLTVTKSDTPDPVAPGENLTYTIVVSNAGPSDAQNVSLTDEIPINTTFVSATLTSGPAFSLAFDGTAFSATAATLAAGATAMFTLTVNVNASTPLPSTIANIAIVTSDTLDPDLGTNSDTEVTLVPAADLAVLKTGPATVTAGESVIYTVTITNSGPNDAQNVVLTDVIPANSIPFGFAQQSGTPFVLAFDGSFTFTATAATFAAGETAVFLVGTTINADAVSGSTATNTATITSDTTDLIDVNNSSAVASVVQTSADLQVVKVDAPDPVAAGGNVTYTITLTNEGLSDAQNVTLTDAIPANTTFVSFTAPAGFVVAAPPVGGTGDVTATAATFEEGATATFILVVNVNAGTPDGTVLSNTALVSSDTADPDATNNFSTRTTAVGTAAADLSVTKTDIPDPVEPGEVLTYTIVLTNTGPSDAQNVTLTDAIPANTTFVSFTAPAGFVATTPPVGGTGDVTATAATFEEGATATFTLVVNVNADAPRGSTISNSASVASDTADPTPGNNSDIETTEIPGLPDCVVITLNSPGDSGTATLEDDADNPGSGVLIVTGTGGNDTIIVETNPRNRSQLRVLRNGKVIGTFASDDVQHIVAFGLAGNDKIIVNAKLLVPATLFGDADNDQLFGAKGADGLDGGSGNDRLFGGAGDDTLCGGDGNDFVYGQAGNDFAGGDAGNDKVYGEAGNDLLLGGEGNDNLYGGSGNDRMFGQSGNDQVFGDSGNDIAVGGDDNDKLYGGSGRDLLIGGDGADTLFGDTHDDILVAGPTNYDEDDAALQAILAEWTSSNSYTTRVDNIRFGGGANVLFLLDSATVSDDGLIDTLSGKAGLDWFLFGNGDRLRDKAKNELVN